MRGCVATPSLWAQLRLNASTSFLRVEAVLVAFSKDGDRGVRNTARMSFGANDPSITR